MVYEWFLNARNTEVSFTKFPLNRADDMMMDDEMMTCEDLDEKETEWGNHGVGKPFADTLFDWEELEDKNEARGWH